MATLVWLDEPDLVLKTEDNPIMGNRVKVQTWRDPHFGRLFAEFVYPDGRVKWAELLDD